jgi:hypothetical protein
MDWTKFWPTLIPLVATLLGAFTEQIQTLLAAHPQWSLAIVTLVTAVANAVTPKKQ